MDMRKVLMSALCSGSLWPLISFNTRMLLPRAFFWVLIPSLWRGSQIPVSFRDLQRFLTESSLTLIPRVIKKQQKQQLCYLQFCIFLHGIWEDSPVPALLCYMFLHLWPARPGTQMPRVQASSSKSPWASPTPFHPSASVSSFLTCAVFPFSVSVSSWHHLKVTIAPCLTKSYVRLVLKSYKYHCPCAFFSNPPSLLCFSSENHLPIVLCTFVVILWVPACLLQGRSVLW